VNKTKLNISYLASSTTKLFMNTHTHTHTHTPSNNNNTTCYIRAFTEELKARRSMPERSRVTHNTQQTLNTYTDITNINTHVVQRQGERYYGNRKEIRLYF
jgi:hypothetical protein